MSYGGDPPSTMGIMEHAGEFSLVCGAVTGLWSSGVIIIRSSEQQYHLGGTGS